MFLNICRRAGSRKTMPTNLCEVPASNPEDAKATDIEKRFMNDSYGVGGICGCDGALDYGCPLCTPEREKDFLKKLRALVDEYR